MVGNTLVALACAYYVHTPHDICPGHTTAIAKLQLISTERMTHLCQNEVDIPWIEFYSIVQSTLSFLVFHVTAIICTEYDHPVEIPHCELVFLHTEQGYIYTG